VKVVDENGNPVRNENGDVVLEEAYSVATGTVLTINTKTKKLYNGEKGLKDISKAFTPQNGIYKAGGSYAIVLVKNCKLCLKL
jgi:aconitate hydratase 2/2-methylisocitrate dehydratase